MVKNELETNEKYPFQEQFQSRHYNLITYANPRETFYYPIFKQDLANETNHVHEISKNRDRKEGEILGLKGCDFVHFLEFFKTVSTHKSRK